MRISIDDSCELLQKLSSVLEREGSRLDRPVVTKPCRADEEMIRPYDGSSTVREWSMVPLELSVSGRSPSNDRQLSPLRAPPRVSEHIARRLSMGASPRDRSCGPPPNALSISPRAASPRNYAADIGHMLQPSAFPDCALGTIYSPSFLPRLPTRASQRPMTRDRPPTRHISCPVRLQGFEEEETLRRLSTVREKKRALSNCFEDASLILQFIKAVIDRGYCESIVNLPLLRELHYFFRSGVANITTPLEF